MNIHARRRKYGGMREETEPAKSQRTTTLYDLG
jgi:hypothetical protein